MSDAEIGQSIQRARYISRLTQSELAQAVGLDRTAVSRIEQGKRALTATELVVFAQALAVELTDLLQPAPPPGAPAARLLLRAERVSWEDHHQLRWFLALYEKYMEAATPRAPVHIPEQVHRFPARQSGELAARALRAKLALSDAPIRGLSGIAGHLGIMVVAARLPSRSRIDGCLVREPGRAAATLINSSYPRARQRYTLAHEIAHFILDHDLAGRTCAAIGAPRPGRRSPNELRADVFASAFLLPKRAVTKFRARGQVNWEGLRWLEREFGMSHAATIARLRGLRVLPEAEARALAKIGLGAEAAEAQPAYRKGGQTMAALIGEGELGEACEIVPDDEVVA